MKVRRYKKEDYALIESWMTKHGMEVPRETRLPKWGIIVGECAMVFLVKTDCRIALLEYFITDPDADAAKRQEACNLGIIHAERAAEKKGYEIIGATVTVPRVAELLHSWGYRTDAKPYVVFKKLLKGKEDVRSASSSSTESSAIYQSGS